MGFDDLRTQYSSVEGMARDLYVELQILRHCIVIAQSLRRQAEARLDRQLNPRPTFAATTEVVINPPQGAA